jgi:hypothetical protein
MKKTKKIKQLLQVGKIKIPIFLKYNSKKDKKLLQKSREKNYYYK